MRIAPTALLCATLSICAHPCVGQDLLTANYGNSRTNADLYESTLNTSNVNSALFGKLFTLPVDGQIYAQPLYQSKLTIKSAVHNVVFIATLHNSVYAYDADIPGPPLWNVNLGPSVPAASYNSQYQPGPTPVYTDISPEIGILSTPVIDPVTHTLYAVAATLEQGKYYYKLHALDTATGAAKLGSPATIQAQVKGTGDASHAGIIIFDPLQHIQRPALLLANGVVYVSFGAHADTPPYHGWVFGYKASNVKIQTGVFNASLSGRGASIWQSGRGPVADDQGNIFVVSGNGDSDGVVNFGNNVLKLTSALSLSDWFSPADVQTLDQDDADLGASGPLLIPGTFYLIAGGKSGTVYVLDKTALGHQTASNTQVVQSFTPFPFGIFNMAIWPRVDGPVLYLEGSDVPISAYKFTINRFSTSPSSQSTFQMKLPFQGMTVSANGSKDGTGILWVTTPDTYPLPSAVTLRAYDAGNLAHEIWDSSIAAADAAGGFSKFVSPTVANSKVYVPTTSKQLVVYGLKTNSPNTPSMTALVNAASYSDQPVAPGEIIALYGTNLGPAPLTANMVRGSSLSTQLAGTQVMFNGVAAPLLYTSAGVLSAVVPFELAGSSTASVQIVYNGQFSSIKSVSVVATAPAIFSNDATGRGQGAILNQDGSLNSEANPADAGSIIAIFATGGGQTTPGGVTGRMAGITPLPLLAATVSATAGGLQATLIQASDAPGLIQGVMQVNVQLPAGVAGMGNVPLVLKVGNQSSQSTITVAVK